MKPIAVFLVSTLCAVSLQPAYAASYPDKPIRLVVPFPPGGSVNLMGRILADRLSTSLGQQVVVENRAGAAGIMGANVVAKAAPDGYTLLLATMGAQSIQPAVSKNLPFDPKTDFSPIALFASVPNVLVVSPQTPAATATELISYAKRHPNQLNMGSAGAGSANHLVGELFMLRTGAEFTHVPYKGAGPAMVDLLGNRVQLTFVNLPNVLSHVRAGKLRALALASATRSPALPDVPTMQEAGIPDAAVDSWFGVMGPKGMPADVVTKLADAVTALAKDPATAQLLAEQGAQPMTATPSQFATLIRNEAEKWDDVVKKGKVTLQ